MTTGRTIVALRQARGWTQGQLATYAQVDQSYLSRLERGEHPNVSAVVLDQLARALGVTVEYLLHGDTAPEAAVAPFREEPVAPAGQEGCWRWSASEGQS